MRISRSVSASAVSGRSPGADAETIDERLHRLQVLQRRLDLDDVLVVLAGRFGRKGDLGRLQFPM